jgi:hypothetical protein
MPDHFHGIVFVKEPQRKKLGNIVGSFKSKSSSRAGKLASTQGGLGVRGKARDLADGSRGAARAPGLWAPGYVDLILFRKGQLGKMGAYIRDNPRRLGVKQAHPELFRVVRDLEVEFAARGEGRDIPVWKGPARGHFEAVGNRFLLDRPVICQIQCSRALFAYKRERLPGGWRICREADGTPIVEKTTPEFEEKSAAALRAGAHGAVLLSPCISHGEREIARRAFEAGCRVIALRHTGFPPLGKLGGRLFEACAAGKLLMLAPCGLAARGKAQDAGSEGREAMTREQAMVLNRIAQLIAGEGAVGIAYRGAEMEGIDEAVARAVDPAARGGAQEHKIHGGEA